MTPAINLAKKAKIAFKVHEYTHDPASESYGLEAAAKLGLPPTQVFKTLVVSLDGKELAVGILPVAAMLSSECRAARVGNRTCPARLAKPDPCGVYTLDANRNIVAATNFGRCATSHQ